MLNGTNTMFGVVKGVLSVSWFLKPETSILYSLNFKVNLADVQLIPNTSKINSWCSVY